MLSSLTLTYTAITVARINILSIVVYCCNLMTITIDISLKNLLIFFKNMY
jgi:hypothetical protein